MEPPLHVFLCSDRALLCSSGWLGSLPSCPSPQCWDYRCALHNHSAVDFVLVLPLKDGQRGHRVLEIARKPVELHLVPGAWTNTCEAVVGRESQATQATETAQTELCSPETHSLEEWTVLPPEEAIDQ